MERDLLEHIKGQLANGVCILSSDGMTGGPTYVDYLVC